MYKIYGIGYREKGQRKNLHLCFIALALKLRLYFHFQLSFVCCLCRGPISKFCTWVSICFSTTEDLILSLSIYIGNLLLNQLVMIYIYMINYNVRCKWLLKPFIIWPKFPSVYSLLNICIMKEGLIFTRHLVLMEMIMCFFFFFPLLFLLIYILGCIRLFLVL